MASELLATSPQTDILASKPQTDSLGQFIGTKKTETPEGTLFEGTQGGNPYSRFVKRPAGLYNSSLPADNNSFSPVPTSNKAKPAATLSTVGAYTPVTAPSLLSKLSGEEQAQKDAELKAQIENLTYQSDMEIANIQQKGKVAMGSSRSFLAKAGALGRTISGAPVETNLGVLGSVQQKVDAAVREEKQNLQNAIVGAQSAMADKIQKRIDALNALAQTNFDNALKVVQEDRAMSSEARATKLNDLNYEQLSYNLENGKKEDVIKSLENMAKSGVPIDEMSNTEITDYETKAGLPAGSFANYYKALTDYQKVANETNKLALDQAKANLEQTNLENKKIVKDMNKPTGGGGGGGNTIFKESTAVAEMSPVIQASVGPEGFISKEDWSQLLDQWNTAGGSTESFVKNFKRYANNQPNYKYVGLE